MTEEEGRVGGIGRYNERFGIITDISKEHLRKAFGNSPLSALEVYIKDVILKGVMGYYSQVPEGELIAIEGNWSRLEISVNLGSAIEAPGCSDPCEVEVELRKPIAR